MKFRCDGLELSEAISVVSKAISNKTTSQILEGIKMVCVDDKLILSATDLEMSIEKTIRAEVETNGETVVPGRLFGEYIKKLTNEQIECECAKLNDLKANCAKYNDIRKQKNVIKKLKKTKKEICDCYEKQFKALLSDSQKKKYNKYKKCK